MARTNRRYGWVPDLPDHRDIYRYYSVAEGDVALLPPHVDLRSYCPPVYDQGDLGSCVAQAVVGALQFDEMKQHDPDIMRSRLQVYYDARVILGTPNEDSGAQIRDGIKVAVNTGAAPESLWPYDIDRFTWKPPQSVYDAAKRFTAIQYARIGQTVSQIKGALAGGIPIVFGFTVYTSFESAEVERTGVVPMPGPFESVLGGHAVLAVGYNSTDDRVIVRNSWGAAWGQAGYFTMPMDYLTDTDLSDDFWCVMSVAQ
jgi:C1A family cysteine protease